MLPLANSVIGEQPDALACSAAGSVCLFAACAAALANLGVLHYMQQAPSQ
jgi:hypothetical protein